MNRFPLTRFIPPLSACLVLLLGVNAGHAAGNMLIGQWLVTGVKTNTSTMRTTRYHYDDARLFGRVFNFSTDRISDNTPENETCTSPVLKHSRMQAAELWGKSMAVTFDDPPPSPTHYELPVAHHSSVDVIFITCKEGLYGGSLGMPKGIEGAWLLRLGDNQLALRWYDETILVLTKVTPAQKPAASFNCAKAGTETEKAICGSIALAAYDRSLAGAYKLRLDFLKEEGEAGPLQQFKQAQKAWLAKRDACRSDAECLEKSMQDRLNELLER